MTGASRALVAGSATLMVLVLVAYVSFPRIRLQALRGPHPSRSGRAGPHAWSHAVAAVTPLSRLAGVLHAFVPIDAEPSRIAALGEELVGHRWHHRGVLGRRRRGRPHRHRAGAPPRRPRRGGDRAHRRAAGYRVDDDARRLPGLQPPRPRGHLGPRTGLSPSGLGPCGAGAQDVGRAASCEMRTRLSSTACRGPVVDDRAGRAHPFGEIGARSPPPPGRLRRSGRRCRGAGPCSPPARAAPPRRWRRRRRRAGRRATLERARGRPGPPCSDGPRASAPASSTVEGPVVDNSSRPSAAVDHHGAPAAVRHQHAEHLLGHGGIAHPDDLQTRPAPGSPGARGS